MKHTRKFICIALALIMALSILTATASAVTYYIAYPEAGDYYIVCSNGGYALDVTGGGDAVQCTPIQLYEMNQTDAQIWTLERTYNEWYRIVHKRTGMVLNVQNGDARADGRLWLYPFDGTGACYWRFVLVGNQYIIQNLLGDQFVLDLHDNVSYNGALVHLWNLHDGPSALWKLEPVTSSNSGGTNSASYFPKYTGNSASIVTALNSIGAQSSYAYRKRIAAANGINGYSGTASQNTALLNRLKNGTLINPDESNSSFSNSNTFTQYFPQYAGNSGSIVTALNSIGAQSSYTYRKQIAAVNGISGYTGTASQNTTLLKLLKEGSLVRPEGTSASDSNTLSSSGNIVTNKNYNVSVLPKSRENQPLYTNSVGQRGASALNTVIDQFEVTTNTRYQRDSNGTYCNIFAWDVTSALGCEIPHWVLNNAPSKSKTSGAKELNVNATYNWLNSYGNQYGWYTVSAHDAQQRANSGYPTIAIWRNISGGSGHIAVVRPEGNNYSYSSAKGPVIAQAGANNYNYANLCNGFSRNKMPAVVFWTHA